MNQTLHPFLLDERYWREKLRLLSQVEPRPLMYPRADLAVPGLRVEEFHLRAHDGATITGWVARSVFRVRSQPVTLRVAPALVPELLDRDELRSGAALIAVCFPPSRHLLDRVLDIVRTARALAALGEIEEGTLVFGPETCASDSDALRIARHLLNVSGLE